MSSNSSVTATEAAVVGADGNLSVQRRQLVHQQNPMRFSGSIADNSTNPASAFRPILSLLAVTSLPLNISGNQVPGDQVASLSPSWSSDDFPSPTYTSLSSNGSSADREEGQIDTRFELCVRPASITGSPDLAYGFDQSLPKEDDSVLDIQVSPLQSLLEPQLLDERDCRIDTPLLDLQEQGYVMVSPGKTIVPREFEECLAVVTENLMLISLKDDAPVVDKWPSSPLDARYLEHSPSHSDIPLENSTEQDCSEPDVQDEIYLTWLLQWDAIEVEGLAPTNIANVMTVRYVINMDGVFGQCALIAKDEPMVLEEQPPTPIQARKHVRFDPYVHVITSCLVRHDGELASASSETTYSSPITDLRLDLASLPPLPDSPVPESSPYFVKAEFHHLLPALPLSPTLASESVMSAIATAESCSSLNLDVVDLFTLPPLPPSPEVDSGDTFLNKDPFESLPTQDTNTDTDPHPPQPSSNLRNPRVVSLQLNIEPRQHLDDESASPRSWTTIKSPVSTIRHISAASPMTPASPRTVELAATRQQLQYWNLTATKLRAQERMLTARIDTLITEMAELIDRCEASEMGLLATEDELEELQRKLAEEQELGFASIREAALSIQENHLLGIALEETWKELDLMRGAWVDMHRQQRVEQEVKCQASQGQSFARATSLLAIPCSYSKNTCVVGTKALVDSLSCLPAEDTGNTKGALSLLKFVAISLMLTVAMTVCLIVLLGDQHMMHRAGGAVILARRAFQPVAYRYSMLAKDEILEHWVEISQAVGEHAKTAVVAPVQHAIAAWSGMVEYQSEMWSLLTASSSRYSLL
ncbi:hypothetical protein BGZ82_009424 [Podila clonocystis]|nr:hypothetical protein BGZ82_009424 [Podila clonocystis]